MSASPVYVWRRNREYAQWPTGHVYFATFTSREDARDAVKIGWSQNPWYRVVTLSAEYKSKIEVFDTVEVERGSKHWGVAYGSLEYRIHRELAAKRVHPWTLKFSDRGEWYGMSREQAIELAATVRRNIAREDAAQQMASGPNVGPTSSSTSNAWSCQQ